MKLTVEQLSTRHLLYSSGCHETLKTAFVIKANFDDLIFRKFDAIFELLAKVTAIKQNVTHILVSSS